MRIRNVMSTLVAVFTNSLIGYCDEDVRTPKATVKGMMEAVKAGDYEKAIGYMDLEGICASIRKQMDEQTKDMSEEEKKEFDEMIGEEMKSMMDPEKFKEKMIEQMKEDEDIQDFTYEITNVSDEKDGVVMVTVKITPKDGEPDEEEFPVKKVGGVWKVSFPEMS